jgi:hypothetical protein
MKNAKNYKARYYMMLFAIPVCLFLLWKTTVADTLKSYQKYKLISAKIRKYPDPYQRVHELTNTLSTIQHNEMYDPNLFDNWLIDMISSKTFKYEINLEAIPDIHDFCSQSYIVRTYKIIFSGRFVNLLKFINYIESSTGTCNIISLNFYRSILKGGSEKLFLDIYIQKMSHLNKSES